MDLNKMEESLRDEILNETTKARHSFLDYLEKKYVTNQDECDEIDLDTLTIVSDKGTLDKLRPIRFGTYKTYSCPKGRKAAVMLKKIIKVRKKYKISSDGNSIITDAKIVKEIRALWKTSESNNTEIKFEQVEKVKEYHSADNNKTVNRKETGSLKNLDGFSDGDCYENNYSAGSCSTFSEYALTAAYESDLVSHSFETKWNMSPMKIRKKTQQESKSQLNQSCWENSINDKNSNANSHDVVGISKPLDKTFILEKADMLRNVSSISAVDYRLDKEKIDVAKGHKHVLKELISNERLRGRKKHKLALYNLPIDDLCFSNSVMHAEEGIKDLKLGKDKNSNDSLHAVVGNSKALDQIFILDNGEMLQNVSSISAGGHPLDKEKINVVERQKSVTKELITNKRVCSRRKHKLAVYNFPIDDLSFSNSAKHTEEGFKDFKLSKDKNSNDSLHAVVGNSKALGQTFILENGEMLQNVSSISAGGYPLDKEKLNVVERQKSVTKELINNKRVCSRRKHKLAMYNFPIDDLSFSNSAKHTEEGFKDFKLSLDQNVGERFHFASQNLWINAFPVKQTVTINGDFQQRKCSWLRFTSNKKDLEKVPVDDLALEKTTLVSKKSKSFSVQKTRRCKISYKKTSMSLRDVPNRSSSLLGASDLGFKNVDGCAKKQRIRNQLHTGLITREKLKAQLKWDELTKTSTSKTSVNSSNPQGQLLNPSVNLKPFLVNQKFSLFH